MKIATRQGKVVGDFKNGVYTKIVNGSTHKMKSPAGWSNDKDIVDNLHRMGCGKIVIEDKETGEVWSISMADYLENAIYLFRGYGEQLVVPFKYWKLLTDILVKGANNVKS